MLERTSSTKSVFFKDDRYFDTLTVRFETDAIETFLADVEAIVQSAARVGRVIEPRPEHARRYDERFAIYRDLYPQTRELSHRIFALGE